MASCTGPKHSHVGGASHVDHVDGGAASKLSDIDNDGVPNMLDNCPGIAGPKENYGCKESQLVILRKNQIEILEHIFFKTDSAEIEERSFPLLDNIASVMKVHPEIPHVRIEGHTDNTGDPAYNIDLSQRRAEAVVQYLKEHGIGEERISGRGFGAEQPIEDNGTEEGRAANRRVAFTIMGVQ